MSDLMNCEESENEEGNWLVKFAEVEQKQQQQLSGGLNARSFN